ncbi:MAG: sporulation transcriptional regulator SpoIIID [bacterium]|nr:sporulation transcriptional regulator SpoIIID [bacterium]
MIDKDTLIREANYYLENDVTLQQMSVDLGVSKKTLQNHFKALQNINPNLFEKIQKKKEENINKGRSEGGKNISRVSKYTEHDALKIAKIMVEKEMTYRQAEEYFGIPKSTIFEILTSKLNSQEYGSLLSALSSANKEGLSIQEFISKHSTEHVNSDIIGKIK